MRSYLLWLAVVLVGIVLAGCVETPSSMPGPNVRTEATDIKGVDSAGNELKLSDYRGKVVLVDFWFDQCGYCRQNHVEEKHLLEKYKDRPFVILGVNTDRDPETMARSEKEQKLTWPSIADGKWGLNSRAYSVQYFPTLLLVDHKGRLAVKPIEGMPQGAQKKQLDSAIDRLVQEAEQDVAKTTE